MQHRNAQWNLTLIHGVNLETHIVKKKRRYDSKNLEKVKFPNIWEIRDLYSWRS